jgi:phage gp29-like protein
MVKELMSLANVNTLVLFKMANLMGKEYSNILIKIDMKDNLKIIRNMALEN